MEVIIIIIYLLLYFYHSLQEDRERLVCLTACGASTKRRLFQLSWLVRVIVLVFLCCVARPTVNPLDSVSIGWPIRTKVQLRVPPQISLHPMQIPRRFNCQLLLNPPLQA